MKSITYKLIFISAIVALCAGAAMAEEDTTEVAVVSDETAPVEETVTVIEENNTTEAAPVETEEETVEEVAEETLAENLTISMVNATQDSVEITNDALDLSLLNYTLTVDNNETVVLPDYSLGAGDNVTVFFGTGIDTDTELFLNSTVVLNDMGGNVTLKDPAGIELSMAEF